MFQFKVKGSALKNLLALHMKHGERFQRLREQSEREQEALAAKDAEAMQSLPAHMRSLMPTSDIGGYTRITPLAPAPRIAALKAIDEAMTKHGIALNRWFCEQLQDDEIYTVTSDDMRAFGLSTVPARMLGGCVPFGY
jgi:hypothetical protein